MRTYIRKQLQVQEIEDVQSLCRLCLGKTEEMVSIFDGSVDDMFTGLSMRIGTCLGLEVSREDAFPKFICQLCNSELNKFYAFKKNCTATYRKLKASLFAIKQIDRKKGNDETNQEKTTNIIVSGNGNIAGEQNITINTSQTLKQSKLSIELLRINSHMEKESVQKSNDRTQNNTTPNELRTDKDDCHKTPVFQELSEHTTQTTPSAGGTMEGFVNDNQLDEVHSVSVKTQEEDKKEKSDDLKTTQCLPAFIVTNLIDKGVLAKRDDTLEILNQSIKTFTVETPCGSKITMELIEEDAFMPGDECNNPTRPKIFNPDLKSDARCCGACGARFPSRGALARHLRVHSGEKPFACRACGRRFAQREVLRRHQLLHSDKLPYQCARCPKAYTQRGALAAHARTHEPPAARPLILHRCSRCPKVFLYPSGLSRHMSVHRGRDYPCDECSRTFTDKSSLQRHRRVHQRRAR